MRNLHYAVTKEFYSAISNHVTIFNQPEISISLVAHGKLQMQVFIGSGPESAKPIFHGRLQNCVVALFDG